MFFATFSAINRQVERISFGQIQFIKFDAIVLFFIYWRKINRPRQRTIVSLITTPLPGFLTQFLFDLSNKFRIYEHDPQIGIFFITEIF